MDGHLTKPFQHNHLAEILEKVTQSSSAGQPADPAAGPPAEALDIVRARTWGTGSSGASSNSVAPLACDACTTSSVKA